MLWHADKWGGGRQGSIRQRGPVFSQMPVWPQRSGCRRWRAKQQGHVPSHREHSLVVNRKENQAFFLLGCDPSPLASVSSRALVRPHFDLSLPSLFRLQCHPPPTDWSSHSVPPPDCTTALLFLSLPLFLHHFSLWPLVTSWQSLKALIDSPVSVFVFTVLHSHTVMTFTIGHLFYLSAALLSLLWNLSNFKATICNIFILK